MKKDIETEEVLNLLFSFMPKIAGENRLENLLETMADLGKQLVVADRCSLWLLDKENNELWTRVAQGLEGITLRMSADKGFVGYAVQTGESISIKDAYNDKRHNPTSDTENNYRTRSVLVIPIKDTAGEIIGAYQAINKLTPPLKGEKHSYFSERDREFLGLTAVYSGKTLESAILMNEIERTQREALFMMGEISESRSRETGNHVKRVAQYCRLLGKYYGMPKSELELMVLASPMHDVGKVATPDSILKKPGRLTDEEFDEMKRHTIIGYEVMKRSPTRVFQEAAIIAYTHHEKWNGFGYPNGLSGVDIPINGRICAVADVFDALSNDRCYKKAWPLEKVIALFEEEKGEHFDPDIAQILLDNIDRFEEINFKYHDEFIEE
ncbi:MAG: HD domain-containing protein [Fibrobacter sp.]|nr:HD domain-containing protein [Fibrobacter sp.]